MTSPLDAFFPRSCAGCRAGPWPFCPDCAAALRPLSPPWCARCGRPAPEPVSTCHDCPPPPVTSARAAFLFAGPARRAVHRLKYSGWRDVSTALADAMRTCSGVPAVDVVTWVPLARTRRAERGFDQARALATAYARRSGVPARRLLRRVVAGGPQARKGGADRRTAVRGAFTATRSAPPRVLLVDDVLTTGATAAACAQALTDAGAREVHLLVAARSFHDRAPLRPAARAAYPREGSRPGLWLPGDPPR